MMNVNEIGEGVTVVYIDSSLLPLTIYFKAPTQPSNTSTIFSQHFRHFFPLSQTQSRTRSRAMMPSGFWIPYLTFRAEKAVSLVLRAIRAKSTNPGIARILGTMTIVVLFRVTVLDGVLMPACWAASEYE